MRPHVLVILHHENGLSAAAVRRMVRRCLLGGSSLVRQKPRQIEPHRRAMALLAVEPHMSARLLDEAVHLAEAKAGALSNVLRGVEWLEGVRLDLARHARAGVADRHDDIL